jgi:hypothetical protein
MMVMTTRGPLRWAAEAGVGLYRSAVLVGLTGVMPVSCAAVAYFGAGFAFTWTANLNAALAVRVLAAAGEILITIVWTSVVAVLLLRRGSRPITGAARRLAKAWLGLPLRRTAPGHPDVHRLLVERPRVLQDRTGSPLARADAAGAR